MGRTTLLLVFALVATTAAAQQQVPIRNLTADDFLLPEDAAHAKAGFVQLRDAVLRGDKDRVATLLAYPFYAYGTKDSPLRIQNSTELLSRYDSVFTPFVTSALSKQSADSLPIGWEGFMIVNGAARFRHYGDGVFRAKDVRVRKTDTPAWMSNPFEPKATGKPVVILGRIVAFNWASHIVRGFENIFIDSFLVRVEKTLSSPEPLPRYVRVDFWGVHDSDEYTLPEQMYRPGQTWRFYLRPAAISPFNSEVCRPDYPVDSGEVDVLGGKVDENTPKDWVREKAVRIVEQDAAAPLKYSQLPCYEIRKQFVFGAVE